MLAVIPVQGSVKNYHWGKVGDDSYIARFQSTKNPKNVATTINNNNVNTVDKPMAELWFGAHPSGPATVIAGNHNLRLDEFLAKEPEMVGGVDFYYKYNKKLPFLFKILSIAQPLSLQAHPNKKLAQVLHTRDPKNYPDANHKPELAIALTEFEVLCDFRPSQEIVQFLSSLGSLRRIVGEKNFETYQKTIQSNGPVEQKRSSLASCFKALMTSDHSSISKETKNLLSEAPSCKLISHELLKLIVDLEKRYPGDPGVFAPFFLNYLKLAPGQAVYLKANKLHAYIKGECIECMACSDNVVRAGLTSKYRDVETLIGMLDYDSVRDAKDVLFEGVKHGAEPSIVSFAPTEEFKVDKISITNVKENGDFTIPAVESGSFIVVFGGEASTKDFFDLKLTHHLALGSAGFVPPKIALKLNKIQGPLTIYRAYC